MKDMLSGTLYALFVVASVCLFIYILASWNDSDRQHRLEECLEWLESKGECYAKHG